MTVGFFLALRGDAQHYLHAASLVAEVHQHMPGVEVVQLSDQHTPPAPGVSRVMRVQSARERPLLDLRLELYLRAQDGPRTEEWLLVDTDVSVRNDVRGVFPGPIVEGPSGWDVALTDRNWPHLPQGEAMLQQMPFNTGVVFSRSPWFWECVLETWRGYPPAVQADWMSEQRAVYEVVRSGRHRVKILPGMNYNYPPSSQDDSSILAALVHYKGNRKPWLSAHAMRVLSRTGAVVPA
jgi:hypothetical protein